MGEGVWRWGKREIIYQSLHCHHQNDSCITMGSDESHFNASAGSDGQSHRTVSTNHNLSERKRRAEAVSNRGPSAYQLNALPPGQTDAPLWLCSSEHFYKRVRRKKKENKKKKKEKKKNKKQN